MKRTTTELLLLIVLPLTLVITACASAPGGPQPPEDNGFIAPPVTTLPEETPPTGSVETVRGRLAQLGFDPADEESKPRMLSSNVSVSEEYSPLGLRARIAPFELFAAGIGSDCLDTAIGESDASRVLSMPLLEMEARTSTVECYAYEEGDHELTYSATPDASYGKPGAQSTRAIAAGDFNGDDLQEGVVVYASPGAGGEWFLHSYRTERGSAFVRDDTWLPGPASLGFLQVVDVEAVAADVDGDGLDDLVVAVVIDDGSTGVARELRLMAYMQERAGDMAAAVTAFSHAVPYGTDLLSVRLASGNFAEGFQDQLVLVLRSIQENSSPMPLTAVDYWVLGQQSAGSPSLSTLQEDALVFTYPDGSTQEFLTADAAFGDFDGDGFEELAFTGILAFPEGDDFCAPYRFGYRIFDDLLFTNGTWTELTSLSEMVTVGDCDQRPGLVYEVFANALDYDGGYTKELLANDRIFRFGLPEPAEEEEGAAEPEETEPFLMLVHALGRDVYASLDDSGHFSEATSGITVGDFDNDGFDEVAFYTSDGVLEIRGQGDAARYGEWVHRFQNPSGDRDSYPVLLGYDNDQDGIVVEFIPGSHQVLLTEPIVLAVLIAPPYDESLGQDPADATTSFGTGTTTGQEFSGTTTVTSGVVLGKDVGFSLGPIDFSAGYSNTMTRFLETAQGTAYETTFSTSYTTAGTDAVHFTSFPYDAYDYEIVAAYEPWLVGESYRVLMPRTPLERLVSVKYFDDRVPEGSLQLSSLFPQINGDPSSYLSLSEKNDLRDRVRNGHFGISTFLEHAAVAPPQGSNLSVEMGIEVSTTSFSTETTGTSMDHSVEMSIPGNSVELTTGDGESDSVTYTTGSSMMVGSAIGGTELDSRGSVYKAGMFTYMHRVGDPESPDGQAFQVVNFWVE